MYPQSGWKLSNIREVEQGKNKKRKARLKQNRVFHFNSAQGVPREPSVSSVREGLSLWSNPRFLVEEPKPKFRLRRSPKKRWASTWGSQGLQHFQMVASYKTQNRLSAFERIRVLQSLKKGFFSKNWLKARMKLAKEHEHLKDFRRDSLNLGRYLQGSTTS